MTTPTLPLPRATAADVAEFQRRCKAAQMPLRLATVDKDLARFLRRCHIRVAKGVAKTGDHVVDLAPLWAVQVYGQCLAGYVSRRPKASRGAIARALRRASRDEDFRHALEAAVMVGLAPQLVTTQMGSPPLEER